MMEKKSLSPLETCGIIIIVAIVLLMGITYFPWKSHLPFESQAELEEIRSALPIAEARWKSSGVTDYDIDAIAFNHPGACADYSTGNFLPIHLRVRQGQIIYASEQQKRLEDICDFKAFLPPQVFDTLKDVLENSNPMDVYVSAEFDSTYGFLTSYRVTSNDQLPNPNVIFTFSNFQPVPKKP